MCDLESEALCKGNRKVGGGKQCRREGKKRIYVVKGEKKDQRSALQWNGLGPDLRRYLLLLVLK